MKKLYLISAGVLFSIIVITVFFMFSGGEKSTFFSSLPHANDSIKESENIKQIQIEGGNSQEEIQQIQNVVESIQQENLGMIIEDLVSVCDKIIDYDFKNVCYALAKTDKSYCENIRISGGGSESHGTNMCEYYVSEAIAKEGKIETNMAYTEYMLEKCEELVSNFDETTSQRDLDLCWGNIALEKNNSEDCKRIVDESTKSYCFYKLALNTKNYDLCNFVTTSYEKERCDLISNIDFDRPEACLEHISWVDQKDCLINFAIGSDNSSICELGEKSTVTNGEQIKDDCYDEVTRETKENYCEQIEHEGKRSRCWAFIGKITGNISVCNEKTLGIEYYGIINDLKWTTGYSNFPDKDDCYRWVAIYTKDVSYCENTYYKDACYEGYVEGIVLGDF